MNGRWLRVGVLLALSAMILIRAAPAIVAYTNSDPSTGLTTIGTELGWEANSANNPNNVVQVSYAEGFAYNPSKVVTDSNILSFYIETPKDEYEAKLQNYTVYLWYSNSIHSTQAPPYNTLLLYGTTPEGIADTGKVYTYGRTYMTSFQLSFGSKKLKLQVGEDVGFSHSVSIPASVYIGPDWHRSQEIYTVNEINQLEDNITKGKNGFWVYLGGSNAWRLRYLGRVTVTKHVGNIPTHMKFGVILDTGGTQASYVDNELHDGVYLVVIVLANYYSGHPFYEFWESGHKAVLGNLFILGDGGARWGYDIPLWYYSVQS